MSSCNWRGERSDHRAQCYALSQCVLCLTVPTAYINHWACMESQKLGTAQGYKRQWDTVWAFWYHLLIERQLRNTELQCSHMWFNRVLEWRLSFDSTRWPGGLTTLCFNLMLSHGFLNKWMFCHSIQSVQALESGKSGFESWLFYFIAVWPWAINFVSLGHMFLHRKREILKPNFQD